MFFHQRHSLVVFGFVQLFLQPHLPAHPVHRDQAARGFQRQRLHAVQDQSEFAAVSIARVHGHESRGLGYVLVHFHDIFLKRGYSGFKHNLSHCACFRKLHDAHWRPAYTLNLKGSEYGG